MRWTTWIAVLLLIGGFGGLVAYRNYLDQPPPPDPNAPPPPITFRIGGDSYLGYWFMTSPEMKKEASRRGIGVEFVNDQGAYDERLKKFADKELDIIVLPINNYLKHGAAHQFPGSIVASVAESRGADAIVAVKGVLPNGKVSDLNNDKLKIVYTAASPSEFLLQLVRVDFDLFNLKNSKGWQVEMSGIDKVYERAKKLDGDVFILWEPELTQALAETPELEMFWGSDKFGGYIIDVFVVRKDLLVEKEREVKNFFSAYFNAQKIYSNDPQKLREDIRQTTSLREGQIDECLRKIKFFDLYDNATLQFGIQVAPGIPTAEGVVNSILASTNVMVKIGEMQRDPLAGRPYSIVDPKILKDLLEQMPTEVGRSGAVQRQFAPLTVDSWRKLREIGAMRVEPISFQSGSERLDENGAEAVDITAKLLINNYPGYRVAVRGHTQPGDDEDDNLKLSQERADTVVQRMIAVHGMDANRFLSEGKGSTQPPQRRPDESGRSWRDRMRRVEFILISDNGLQ